MGVSGMGEISRDDVFAAFGRVALAVEEGRADPDAGTAAVEIIDKLEVSLLTAPEADHARLRRQAVADLEALETPL